MDSVLKTRHSRRSVLAAAGGASALALAGLPRIGAARAQATPDASIEASITYGYWDASQQTAVEAQIEAFKVHFPNITVEPQIVPWADYWTKLQTAVGGGEAFDVFWINTASCPVYASVDALLPITSIVGEGGIDPTRLAGAAGRDVLLGRRSVRLPARFRHDRPLLQQGPLRRRRGRLPDDTWTWETFRAMRSKLTDKDRWHLGRGLQTSWQENYYNFIWQNEGDLLNDDRTIVAGRRAAGLRSIRVSDRVLHRRADAVDCDPAVEPGGRYPLPGRSGGDADRRVVPRRHLRQGRGQYRCRAAAAGQERGRPRSTVWRMSSGPAARARMRRRSSSSASPAKRPRRFSANPARPSRR